MRTSIRAAGTVLAAVTIALAGAVLPSPAGAQEAPPSGADAVAACEPLTAVPELGRRACKSVEAGAWLAAGTCRRLPGTEEEVCPRIDGRRASAAATAEHEGSWLDRALTLQHRLDRDVPLVDALLPHTHNSANSTAYEPSLSTLDANQVVTVTDQLELGMRAIELDIHWAPHPEGDPANGFRKVVQCHGQSQAGVHAGCSVDQPLGDRLAEVAAWLHANPGEVVLLYLENVLDDDPAAHAEAVALLEEHLGSFVHRPDAGGGECQGLPAQTLSKGDILDAGKQLLIVGNCGPSGWTDLVFDRYPHWSESGSTTGYACEADRSNDYGTKLVRRYEDSTWLSTMAGGGSHIAPEVMADMVACGVNLPGFDQLHAADPRLPSLVWSWRADEPAIDAAGRCAAHGAADGRFFAEDCARALRVACRTADGTWAVTTDAIAWSDADAACAGLGGAAGTPVNGWDNRQLRAVAGDADVWLAYAQDADGAWVLGGPGIPDVEPDPEPEPDRPGNGNGKGHGGKPDEPGPPRRGPSTLGSAPVAASSPIPADLPPVVLLTLAAGALAGSRRMAQRRRSAAAHGPR